MTSDIEKSIR